LLLNPERPVPKRPVARDCRRDGTSRRGLAHEINGTAIARPTPPCHRMGGSERCRSSQEAAPRILSRHDRTEVLRWRVRR
jgi:hypothetical protein